MFSTKNALRLAAFGLVAAAWLPMGNGLLQPNAAKAAEIIRVGTVVRRPVVRVVPAAPVVVTTPVVRVGPAYPRVVYRHGWYGWRWYR